MNHDVIIIGSGVSGLAAGKNLQMMRPELRVILLEAQNYVGGRIKTSYEWGSPIELGAEFIHGDKSLTAEIAELLHLDTRSTKDDVRLLDTNGEPISEKQKSNYFNLLHYVHHNGRFNVSIKELIDKNPITNEDIVCQLVLRSIEDLEAAGAADIDSGMFSNAILDTIYLGENVGLRSGYEPIVSYFAHGLNVRLNTIANAIKYDSNGVIVNAHDGKTYSAKAAIITVSLGVLKAGSIAFTPELPQTKLEAIGRIGMGNSCKFFIRFRSPDTVRRMFKISDAENATLQTVTNWWSSVSNEHVLIGYCGGDRVTVLLSYSEDHIFKKIIDDLSKVYGSDITGEVVDFRISRWDTNEFVKGSYSYNKVGVSPAYRKVLAEQTPPLFWAGEATQTDGTYAMAHGAIKSGYRAAQDIVAFLAQ